MKTKRLTQFGASLAIILSLFVSAFAVCACTHHSIEAKENHSASCHETASEMTDAPDDQKSETIFFAAAAAQTDCHCFVRNSQPFVVSGIEKIKTEKISALLTIKIVEAENFIELAPIAAPDSHAEKPFYHSRFRRRNSSPRAPPV